MLAILLSVGCSIQHPVNNKIVGRVYGEDFERTFPYKSIPVPLAGAYIQVIPSNKTGYLTDSLGYFKIENLTKKKYHLSFSFVGLESRDTTIVLRVHSTDSLNILLPFSYNKEAYSLQQAQKEIRSGHPLSFGITETIQLDQFTTAVFWKKYKVNFVVYEKELIQKGVQSLGAPLDILLRFNEEIFNYLDQTFGEEWQKEAPAGILGLEDWGKRTDSRENQRKIKEKILQN